MEMRFEQLTRGSGKIYMRLSWDGGRNEVEIVASSASKSGKVLPSAVYRLPKENACVVVLAVLGITQVVSVRAKDSSDRELASITRVVHPVAARLTSQLNTLSKNQKAERIRNMDEYPQNSPLFVWYDWMILNDEHETSIVHGKVTLAAQSRAKAMEPVILRFYDSSGCLLDNGTWTSMGDACGTSEACEGLFERTIGFSVRMPKTCSYIACWASQPSRGLSALRCLRSFEIRERQRDWDRYRDAAQYTDAYDEWFRLYHRATALEIEAQRKRIFAVNPKFSIVVPLYKTPLVFFREMADSVLNQSYGNFELILVNASLEDESLCAEVATYAGKDSRIRVVEVEKNLGIVGNTYTGVDKATGDFVSFFDHDDVLEPDLLYNYVKGINDYPDTDLLYCDEDKLRNDKYECPFFKPDWNPDLLCSQNYVCHLLTVRKAIVDELPREGLQRYEGSQDHHLTLFAAERARNIFHARKALYHWRMYEQSTAANADSKSYTGDAGVLAVQSHLDRCGIDATARLSGVFPNTYHVDYNLAEHPLVSIVIPNKDMVAVLDRCVTSILENSSYDNFEIVIVENNSTNEETFRYYGDLQRRDERVRIVRQPSDGTFNFSRSINFGAKHSKGEYVLLLNNDTEVQAPHWMESMLGHFCREEVGIVGAKLLYPDGLIQHAGVMLHKGTGPFHVSAMVPSDSLIHFCSAQLTSDYSAVTGACLLVNKNLFDTLGGLDESLAVDYNDIDFCLRVRELGKLVVYEPEAVLTHYESISRGSHRGMEQKVEWGKATGKMLRRWTSYYAEGDPYSNPNLSFGAYRKLADGSGATDGFC